MHKVWFYIALLSIIVAGVWLSLPDEADVQKMKQAAAHKAAMHKKAAAKPQAASAVPPEPQK